MAEPLFFIPGFMGRSADFALVSSQLTQPVLDGPWVWPAAEGCGDIADYAERCWPQFLDFVREPCYLYAYSLGGRVVMHWLQKPEFWQHCRHLYLASAHPGLTNDFDRQQRLRNDFMWYDRFRQQPLAQTLDQWYQQPVFQSLSETHKQFAIQAKLTLSREAVAQQLISASLATQLDQRPFMEPSANITYVSGALDPKFADIARTMPTRNTQIFEAAGHIVHLEQPTALANFLNQVYQLENSSDGRQNA